MLFLDYLGPNALLRPKRYRTVGSDPRRTARFQGVRKAMHQADCLFCKIVKGDIPCAKLYETDQVLSFLDISPVARGHALVIPKAHFPNLFELPEELGGPLLAALKQVGRAVMTATGCSGLNVLMSNFESAGQVIFHAHVHVVPRTAGDGLSLWPGKPYDSNESMLRLAEDIRRSLGA